jgi:hypothetical protein
MVNYIVKLYKLQCILKNIFCKKHSNTRLNLKLEKFLKSIDIHIQSVKL